MDFRSINSFYSSADKALSSSDIRPFERISKINIFSLRNRIDRIKKISPSVDTLELLIDRFASLIEYRSIIVSYSAKYPYLYRAVKSNSVELSKLSYRESKSVDSIGRCHNLGESIFYCSNFYGTSILEIDPHEDEVITILIVDLAKGEHSPSLPIINVGKEMLDQGLLPNFIQSKNAAINEKLRLIDSLFNEIMLQEIIDENKNSYYQTIALSKALWRRIQMGSAILYPSRASRHFGLNFAIPAETFVQITEKTYSAFRIRVVKKRSPIDLDIEIIAVSNKEEGGKFEFRSVSERNIFTINESLFVRLENESKRNFKGNNFNHNWFLPPFFKDAEFFIG